MLPLFLLLTFALVGLVCIVALIANLIKLSKFLFSIEEVSINYGLFIETLLDFLIVGFTVFIIVKFINRLNKKAEDPKDKSVSTPKNIQLLVNMNSLLEKQNELLKAKNK